MKKLTVSMVMASAWIVIVMVVFCWAITTSLFGGIVKEHSFVIPDSLDDPAIIQVVEEKTWDCSGKEAKYKQIKFFYWQRVEELTKDNFGTASLVVKSPEGLINRTDALIGNPENKTIGILVAAQNCEQGFAQLLDEETQELTCEVSWSYECEKPEKYLEGEATLSVRPYLWVR
ncbi:MAG: hypothetical protein Q8L10_04970 [Candidatus Moranbacteria bacterium]|nr:hypothetical protein [Candidatus Moranbacteria bacterium]